MKNKEKDVALKKIKKEGGKLFTKTRSNSRIKKNYNPFKVDCKIYKRKGELYMKNEVLEEKKQLNLKEFAMERINRNTKLFSKEELILIKNNIALIEKIYILGFLDSI